MDIIIDIDGGAYSTLSSVVLSRAVLHASGPYNCPHIRIKGYAFATNTPPHGAFRGFGAPQITFAYERQIHKAAQILNLDPFKIREMNMYKLNDITATGQVLRYSVASEKVLQAVQEKIKNTPINHKNTDSTLYGRGLAFYFHGSGFTGSLEARLKGKVAIAFTKDNIFEIRSASTDIGQGAFTILTQIAASTLGVNTNMFKIVKPQTDMVPNSGPTVASRTCMIVGSVTEKAAKTLSERLKKYAHKNSLKTNSIIQIAQIYVKEYGEIEEIAEYESPDEIQFDDETYMGDAYPVFGWACCLADISVDTDTYEVHIDRLIHAVDVGKAINPIIVKGQIEGGTLQALGWALWENVIYKNGRVQNCRMSNSIIPTSMEAPTMETIIIEEPYLYGPNGAKGVGEIPMDGPAVAIANAIDMALIDKWNKKKPDQLPLLPEIIKQLIDEDEQKI